MLRPYSSGTLTFAARTLLVAGVCLLGLIVRLHNLEEQSVWVDEAVSVLPLYNTIDHSNGFMKYDTQNLHIASESGLRAYIAQERAFDPPMVPGYFTLLYGWARMFGTHPYSLRLMSLLAGTLTIWVMYLIGNECGGFLAGLVGALCLSFSLPHVFYAQEIRMYPLLLLGCAISQFSLLKGLKTVGPKWWIMNAAVNVVIIWIHLFSIFLLFAECVIVIWHCLRTRKWWILCGWMVSQAANAIPLLAWLAMVDYSYLATVSAWMTQMPQSFSLLESACKMIVGYGGIPHWDPESPWAIVISRKTTMFTVFLIVVAGSGTIAMRSAYRQCQPGRLPEGSAVAVMLLLLFLPMLSLFAVSSLIKPCFCDRYVFYSSMPLFACAGVLCASVPAAFPRALLSCLLVTVYVYGCVSTDTSTWRHDWKSAIKFIRPRISAGQRMLLVREGHVKCLFANDPSFPPEQVETDCEGRFADFLKEGPASPTSVGRGQFPWVILCGATLRHENHVEQRFNECKVPYEKKEFGSGVGRITAIYPTTPHSK